MKLGRQGKRRHGYRRGESERAPLMQFWVRLSTPQTLLQGEEVSVTSTEFWGSEHPVYGRRVLEDCSEPRLEYWCESNLDSPGFVLPQQGTSCDDTSHLVSGEEADVRDWVSLEGGAENRLAQPFLILFWGH